MNQINHELLFIKLDNGFYSIVNPLISDGIKIINPLQYEVIKLIKKGISEEKIQKLLSIEEQGLKALILSLREKNILIDSDGHNCHRQKINTPVNIIDFWIHVTDDCNLKCRYCFVRIKREHNDFDISNAQALIDLLNKLKDKHKISKFIFRFSGGEPTLKLELVKKLHLLISSFGKANNCQLTFCLYSNLTLLNQKILKFLTDHKFVLNVSLDGIGQYHDISRKTLSGHATFNKVVSNIELARKAGITPNIMTVINNENIDGLKNLIKFNVESNLHCRYGLVHNEDLDYKKLLKIFLECKGFLEKHISTGYAFSKYFQLGDLKFDKKSIYNCGAGISSLLIHTDGSVYYCPQQIHASAPYSNIKETSDLYDFLLNNDFQGQNLPEKCKICKYRLICNGGCPLEREKWNESFCEFNMKIIPFIFSLLSKERFYQAQKNLSRYSNAES